MYKTLFALLALLPVLGLAACKTKPVGPSPARGDTTPAGQYPAVSVEPKLSDFLVVQYDGIDKDGPTNEQPLTVQVPVRSEAREQFLIQYRFTWYDEEDFKVGATGWKMLAMEPGMRRDLKANATGMEATQWSLEIRSSR